MREERGWREYRALMERRPDLFRQSGSIELVLDENTVADFERANDVTIGVRYQSAYHMLLVDLVREGGVLKPYERIVPCQQGAVAAVTVCGEKFVLLRQYRHAIREEQYAFVRGFGEPGVPAADNVKKEVREELDAEAYDLRPLGEVAADSGLTSGRLQVFACRIDGYHTKQGYEGVEEVVLLTDEELRQWIARGRINDGITLASYALYREAERP